MQHQLLQIHEDLILQVALPCIVASCVHHKYEAAFGMDLWQSEYFQYKSAIEIKNIGNNFYIDKMHWILSHQREESLTYILFNSYLAFKFCRTPGSCK
jgi:hypothetical protein